jgi:sedoheptulokinase
VPNDAALASTAPGEWTQDPARLVALAEEAVAWARAAHPQVRAIGVTGQQHGIVYLDRWARPVSPLYTWQDGRGGWPVPDGAGETYAQRLAHLTGHQVASGYGLTTHYVLSQTGQVPAEAVVMATAPDLVAARLGGLAQPRLHPSMAASLGLYRLEAGGFDLAALAAAGLDPALLPAVDASEAPFGAADGLAVAPAIGDNQASFLGAMGPGGGTLVNFGTGSQVSLSVPALVRVPGLETRPHLAGGWLLVGAALCGGAAYQALRDLFAAAIRLGGGEPPAGLYEAMNRAALDVMVGADPGGGLVVDTRFQGTRADPAARGAIGNVGAHNLTPGHLAAGVLRGMVGELGDLCDAALAVVPAGERLVGSGNALRLNAALRRAVAERFGREPLIPAAAEEAAAGAAWFALLGAGLAAPAEVAASIHYT